MAAVRHRGFLKFAVFVAWPLSTCRSVSSYKISLKSDDEIWPKNDFQGGGYRHLEF